MNSLVSGKWTKREKSGIFRYKQTSLDLPHKPKCLIFLFLSAINIQLGCGALEIWEKFQLPELKQTPAKVPQTVTCQVFLATCEGGRSFPDPHCSCRASPPGLHLSSAAGDPSPHCLECLGLSVPAGSPRFPWPQIGSRRGGVQVRSCYSHTGEQQGHRPACSQCKHTFMELLRWGWALMVHPREHSAHPPRNV